MPNRFKRSCHNIGEFKYKNTSLSCANLGRGVPFNSKGVFDNITTYIQQTKKLTNPFGVEQCVAPVGTKIRFPIIWRSPSI